MVYIFFGFLFICAIYDMWNQKIPSVLISGFIAVMAGYRVMMFIRGVSAVTEIACLLLPGALLLILSYVSAEIGSGDGLLIIATGCYLGALRNIGMVFLAFLLAAFVSIGFLIRGKSIRNKKIAFVPFLLMSSLITVSVL